MISGRADGRVLLCEGCYVRVVREWNEGRGWGEGSPAPPPRHLQHQGQRPAAATAILNDTALATAIGGDPVRNPDADTFTCRLKCHAANGEMFYVSFTRKSVRLTSYEDDAILTTVETWADEVTALN